MSGSARTLEHLAQPGARHRDPGRLDRFARPGLAAISEQEHRAEFRRRVVEFVWAGRPVRVVVAELGLAEDTFNSKQRTWVA